jgi:hypothetical protein
MGVLANPRHEKFAQAIAAGKPASRAYEEAGYRNNDGNSGRLNRNEQVKQRIAELQRETAMINKITRDDIIAMILEDRESAHAAKQFAAAGAATERLAKMLGYWVDRQEVKQVSAFDGIDNPEELRAKLIEMAHELCEHRIADALEQADEQEQNAKRH